ncbi:MAG: hypothetical protein OCD01_02095 [Fibrobacterales bacterium]
MKLLAIVLTVIGLATAQSAHDYFKKASFLYVGSKVDQALLEAEEGLNRYPDNEKLQMLKERIEEIKDQQDEQQKKDQQQQNQDENQDQDQQEDQEENKQDQEEQQDQQNKAGESSSQESSPSSNAGSEEPEPQEEDPSESDSTEAPPPEVQEGELTPEQAEELLQNFNEEEMKEDPEKWKRGKGQGRPAKDW